eukprot:CAMPEP_0175164634 /NCGR_PEP_ID=MMETSP0087-20121206/26537_1 /TAXON_ID=136419 /ORGANISM="Unknown Unknown, Strain D1" /LENGTH=46 /DNA_ID= /DNA_START= /DNA_END= /DNA_ORIENTATION=
MSELSSPRTGVWGTMSALSSPKGAGNSSAQSASQARLQQARSMSQE